MKMARVAILTDRKAAERRWRYGADVFEAYLEEIAASAGIPFERLESVRELKAERCDIAVVAISEEDDETLGILMDFAKQGGTIVSCAGLNRMAGRLGCRELAAAGAGYAQLPATLGGRPVPYRYLLAKPWVPLPATAGAGAAVRGIGTLSAGEGGGTRPEVPLLLEIAVGRGRIVRWNVHIPYTVVAFQQGSGPVVEDGVPAPDGTGALDEGILKADDRCEMDWDRDRLRTDTGYPYYAYPYADWWREAFVGGLLREAQVKGLALPFVDYWPEGVEQVAMISHDSDMNIDESAAATLDVLKECGIRSTWCMLEPGYSAGIYERVRQEGHELAYHYNALEMDGGRWDRGEFERQLAFIRERTGEPIVTNKNHYTRYEGWGELFRWCEQYGIRSDQTRGPSKKGNVGFLFGTCRPYYPIARYDEQNRLYRVLEVGFLTQDLNHPSLPDTSVIAPFLDAVADVRGVAHFLFHQTHIWREPGVADALRAVVREAKARGYQFWTNERIWRWEEARRQVRIVRDGNGAARVEQAPPDAVIWTPAQDGQAGSAVRFGVKCVRYAVKNEVGS